MKEVDPRWEPVLRLALKLSRVDFGLASDGGLRTETEQFDLFMRRKTTLDGKNRVSKHQSGLAVDVFAYVDGKANYDHINMLQVAASILQAACHFGLKIKWGGMFSRRTDMPHFEIEEIS